MSKYKSIGAELEGGFIDVENGDNLYCIADIVEELNKMDRLLKIQENIQRSSQEKIINLQNFVNELKIDIDIARELFENSELDNVLDFLVHNGHTLKEVNKYIREHKGGDN